MIMKKFLLLPIAFLLLVSTSGFVPSLSKPVKTKIYASEVFIPIGKSGEKISLSQLSTISKENLEKLTGDKMNFWEAKAFKNAQKKIKKGIDSEGVVTNKKLNKYYDIDGETGFHLGGLALGFLLGLIGVLIAYLIKDEKKPNRTKWAWVGFGILVVLLIATVL